MTDDDERELHRLCDMLREVHESLDLDSPLREAVSKGALALSTAFIHGFRAQLEDSAEGLGRPLTDSQRALLSTIGIESKDSALSDLPSKISAREKKLAATPLVEFRLATATAFNLTPNLK